MDKEITPSFERSQTENESLDLFHEGQQAAINNDNEAAIAKFEQSLAAAQKGTDVEWIAYIKGTLAYLKGEQSELEQCIASAGDNAQILTRLKNGLARRGTINYSEDYQQK